VIEACRRHGKFPGLGGVYEPSLMARYIDMGMRFILCGNDLSMMMAAARDRAANYEEALRLFSMRRFADALERLDALLAAQPDDEPSIQLCEKCQQWIKQPPPKDWDGVTHYSEK